MKNSIAIFTAFLSFSFLPVFGQNDTVLVSATYCKDIKTEKDKFNGKVSMSSPILEPIHLIKETSKGKTVYYLRLSVIGSTPSIGEGVTILLDNGKKIVRAKEETDVSVNSDAKFDHTAFISITKVEMQLLSKSKITDIRLYIFDESIKDGERFKGYANCLLSN